MPPYSYQNTEFEIAGVVHSSPRTGHMAGCNWQFFPTLGVRLLSGRYFTESDETGKRKVVVVNHAMAAKYFGTRNPIGQQLQIAALKTAADPIADPWFEIIGVISDMSNESTRKDVTPEAYMPYTIEGFANYIVFVRTSGNPETLVPKLTTAVLEMDKAVIPQYTWTLDAVLDLGQYAVPRFFTIVLAVFAAIGITLVSVGVYSVISYTVSQQRREIGIRMALGATGDVIRSHVVRSSLRFVYIGSAAGMVLTLLCSRVIVSQVWGVAWYDPLTLCAVLLLMTFVGFLAAYAPSLRASRVSPAVCLRDE